MRITIDIDGKETEAAPKVTPATPASVDEMDAGVPVSSVVTDSQDENVGGPPAWLIEAVERATSADGISQAAEGTSSEDAGPCLA